MRRLLVMVSVLTLAFPLAVQARGPVTDRFERSPIQGAVDPQVLPLAVDDSRPVTVMLQLRGDPVAVVESKAPNKALPKAQRDRVRGELKARQDAIADDVRAQGGNVLSQLQYAYNGMRVRIARNAVASLASLPNVVGIRGIQVQTPGNATS